MTTREKFIVGLMCLAILFGAWELIGNRGSRPAPASPREDAVAQARSIIGDLSKKVVAEKVPEGYQHILSQAGESWTRDPFLLENDALSAEKETEKPETPDKAVQPRPIFNYTGYLQVGDARLAIINGLEYAVGDAMNVDDYYMKSITPHIVVLARIQGSETIELPMQESFPD